MYTYNRVFVTVHLTNIRDDVEMSKMANCDVVTLSIKKVLKLISSSMSHHGKYVD
jgi:hypothetical protein